MSQRHFNLTDRLLIELSSAMRVVAAKPHAHRATPSAKSDDTPDNSLSDPLNDNERKLSAQLMRVNHSGEIAAQALYRGQALVAQNPVLRAELLDAADEEHDHLAWCQQRTTELGSPISLLTPIWYIGSFAIGMAAGLTSDKVSLGFLAETERQVSKHIDGHLKKLPKQDNQSRAILEQMREDEIRHGNQATERGGAKLPKPIKEAMQAASKVMTTLSHRV
ncbi:MAG: 2-polyprenyl-3-methyl-6-methoxy-1,4-benzoquinone monooxygenase [Gammaproteobacteria bacterium]|nr:2-polyprenyl-3-methyl-6-methoxy-1,4-benzoquinone monooxygenase [Gammaproteobacteria bacterium]MCP4089191.1 2-polyprenyl-3-methyl-6-methoxy-1,4-benzoquinone monooxygenase [Gammaproteobacteria bacterium]MCP4276785.1 2-polyprenyl-3-methyl-6-methoxy-1,4-benzoquinone monooxygenase [Gammaproteobacteria bacterium]MCP4830628.1 2-polyprenyl-3-methyl-6-methoxy-1,4-benzoquinone monooxygenase [Gammaproteobacteria bacterium]MCP4928437.1 2-polyprenyl-3-methyl-6-methoxy-1,4-benzoquinone monooxygenase [Gamm